MAGKAGTERRQPPPAGGGGGIEGLEDITDYPALTDRMVKEGYSAEDMAKFWGGNALRVLTAAQAAAK